MTDTNFAQSLKRVLLHEGGYSNDRGDPGGATMWGITHIDYDAYRRRKGEAPQDVRHMSVEERDDIYRNKYWIGARCDQLPSGIDYVVFDGAVNSGVAQSAKWLQRALGVVADGHIGDITIDAAHDAHIDTLIHSMCDQRRKFLQSLRTFSRFGKGWMRRVDEVEAAALKMVEPPQYEAARPAPSDAGAKAVVSDVAQPLVDQSTAAASTAATGGISAIVQQVQSTFAPYSDTLNVIKYVLMAAAAMGLAVTIYSMLKAKQLKEI